MVVANASDATRTSNTHTQIQPPKKNHWIVNTGSEGAKKAERGSPLKRYRCQCRFLCSVVFSSFHFFLLALHRARVAEKKKEAGAHQASGEAGRRGRVLRERGPEQFSFRSRHKHTHTSCDSLSALLHHLFFVCRVFACVCACVCLFFPWPFFFPFSIDLTVSSWFLPVVCVPR